MKKKEERRKKKEERRKKKEINKKRKGWKNKYLTNRLKKK